jgi:hypothetical protein
VALAALLSVLPADSRAQVSLTLGAGASVPLGGYGDVAELGAEGRVGARLPLDSSVRLAADAFFVRNGHDVDGDHSELYGVNVLVGYALEVGTGLDLTPWGGVGGVVHARKSSSFPGLNASRRGVAVTVGLTLSKALGRMSPYLSSFYARGVGDLGTDSYPTEWLAIGAGVEIR